MCTAHGKLQRKVRGTPHRCSSRGICYGCSGGAIWDSKLGRVRDDAARDLVSHRAQLRRQRITLLHQCFALRLSPWLSLARLLCKMCAGLKPTHD